MTEVKKNKTENADFSKFSLIDLLSIIILVGLVFIFVVPVNQAKISQTLVSEAVEKIDFISDKAEEFRLNPENGYYPDISQLNLGQQISSEFFDYTISTDDSLVLAETKPAFGKRGAFIAYSLSNKQYRIGRDENDKISSKYINENWLP